MRINQILADYGDVVPRREFEMIESSYRVMFTVITYTIVIRLVCLILYLIQLHICMYVYTCKHMYLGNNKESIINGHNLVYGAWFNHNFVMYI